jgi:hypothetical protein
MVRVGYRLRQAWHHLYVAPQTINPQIIRNTLPERVIPLFYQMSTGDQAHACSVLAVLLRTNTLSPELAQAALLHDVGKTGAKLSLSYRTIIVILRSLAPGILSQLGQVDAPCWRKPFYVQLHHASIGARLCETVGCAPRVVQLVLNHDLPTDLRADMIQDVELAELWAADSIC